MMARAVPRHPAGVAMICQSISNPPVFCAFRPAKSDNGAAHRCGRVSLSQFANWAGFGDSEGLGAPRAPRRRFFCARRSSTAGGAGRPSGLPVLIPVRQPRIIRHLYRLATVSGGPAILIRTITMNHQTTGEIRPTQSRIRNIAGSVITAADALHAISEIQFLDGAATVTRLEAIIEILCDAAVDLGGIVEGLREVE